MKMYTTKLKKLICAFVMSFSASLLNATEISVKIDNDFLKFSALDALPLASKKFENSGCLNYLELTKSNLSQRVATKNWNVTSGLDYGPFSFISFSGDIGSATSGMCLINETNVAVYYDAELVGVVYTDAKHDCLLGSISLNSYGSIDVYSGCLVRSKFAQITVSGNEVKIGKPANYLACDGITIVPSLIGANIDDARQTVLKFGWLPYKDNPRLFDYDAEYPPYYVSERAAYPELVACAGTGAAFCSFEYISERNSILTMVTAGEEQREVVKVVDTCDNQQEINASLFPSSTDILFSLPVCMFASSFGPMCPNDENQRASHRAFTNQKILDVELSAHMAQIETEDWFYSISALEPTRAGFKFTFTDDAKYGSYLVAEDFFVERNVDLNAWEITRHKLVYIEGVDQSEVGKVVELQKPIVLEGLK